MGILDQEITVSYRKNITTTDEPEELERKIREEFAGPWMIEKVEILKLDEDGEVKTYQVTASVTVKQRYFSDLEKKRNEGWERVGTL